MVHILAQLGNISTYGTKFFLQFAPKDLNIHPTIPFLVKQSALTATWRGSTLQNSPKPDIFGSMTKPEVAGKPIAGNPLTPQRYNILLTRHGEEIAFDFPPATADLITRFGYIVPTDTRCNSGLIQSEEDVYRMLEAVLGRGYRGNLAYHTRKQVIISLHDTAILGYQRQSIIDPRLSNEVALFWEIYLDQRIFPQSQEEDWQTLLSELVIEERTNPESDKKLAEDIKNRLLEQAKN